MKETIKPNRVYAVSILVSEAEFYKLCLTLSSLKNDLVWEEPEHYNSSITTKGWVNFYGCNFNHNKKFKSFRGTIGAFSKEYADVPKDSLFDMLKSICRKERDARKKWFEIRGKDVKSKRCT